MAGLEVAQRHIGESSEETGQALNLVHDEILGAITTDKTETEKDVSVKASAATTDQQKDSGDSQPEASRITYICKYIQSNRADEAKSPWIHDFF